MTTAMVEEITFVVRGETAEYRVPNGDVRAMVEKIGWKSLFTKTSPLRRVELDEQERATLEEFLRSYDPKSRSGSIGGGVRVFLTKEAVVRAFGLSDRPGLRLVRANRKGEFRCGLLEEDAKRSGKGIWLRYVKDVETRWMLRAASVAFTGNPWCLGTGMLLSVWESIHGGTTFDWAAFMLRNITRSLAFAHKRLGDHGSCNFVLGRQLLAVLSAARTVVPSVVPSDTVVDAVNEWIGGTIVGEGRDCSSVIDHGDVSSEECTAGMEDAGVMVFRVDPFEELVLLVKRTIKDLLALRRTSLGIVEDIEPQRIEEMKCRLWDLIVAAAGNGQQQRQQSKAEKEKAEVVAEKEKVCSRVEKVEAENEGLRSMLLGMEAEVRALQSENLNLEVLSLSLKNVAAEVDRLQRRSASLEAENEKLTSLFVNEEVRDAEKEKQLEELRFKFRLMEDPFREAHIGLGEQRAENARLWKRVRDLELECNVAPREQLASTMERVAKRKVYELRSCKTEDIGVVDVANNLAATPRYMDCLESH